jgi:hypothetical protein
MCETRCGLVLYGMLNGSHVQVPSGWTCEALQAHEDKTIAAFKFVLNDERFQSSCGTFGYRLFIHPDKAWEDYPPRGYKIGGITYCNPAERNIVVGLRDTPEESALSHELAHAVQDCDTRYYDPNWPDHGGWTENGIFSAIDSVRVR